MPAYSSANNASTTLAAAITTTGQTAITVTSAAGFPTSGNYVVQIDTELLLVTAGQGTTAWTVSRGVEGSSAATHLNTAPTTLIWTTDTLLSWGGGDSAGGAPGYWPTLAPVGLTGATAASRYVGATNSGPPVTGTFGVGDFVVDRSVGFWVCTAAGTPGTWVASANATVLDVSTDLGSPPAAATGRFFWAGGSTVLTTGGGGGVAYNFPAPFPNGLICIIPTFGNTSASVLAIALIQAQCTRFGFGAVIYVANTAQGLPPGNDVEIGWMALGY